MAPTPPQQALTIFLIKDGKELKEIVPEKSRLTYIPFNIAGQDYDLYAKKTRAYPPTWARFFPDAIDKTKLGKSSSPGAVLLTMVDDRKYALTFGSGRYLLHDECREEHFGLKTVLNSVSKVRSIDKNSFDSINGKTRTQASREFPIGLFGIDVEKDLLKAVTGIPSDKAFGSRMSGIDGLSVMAGITIEEVPDFIRKIYHQYTLEDYKKGDFAFVDQIRPIKNKSLIESLDKVLVTKLNIKPVDPAEIELILPDIVDFSDLEHFRYEHKPSSPENLLDISLKTFLTTCENKRWDITLDMLKSRYVYSTHANDEVRKAGTIHRCLLAEIDQDGAKYILSEGKWYLVDGTYLQKIDNFVASADRYPHALPVFRHDDGEGEYNEYVRDNVDGFYMLDRDLIHPEKSQSIEFCDLYSEANGSKDIVHVKVGKSSSALSHLFSQGTVSAEAFLEFPEIRTQVDVKLRKYGLSIANPAAKINTSDYRIVFAIIRKKGSKLPFFARVNLRQAFRMLTKWNYSPMLAEVDIDPAWLLKKNLTKKAAKKAKSSSTLSTT
jgi:uncharacterized protein (TIGR04141 family)